jgi:hypothetical protein
LKVLLDENMPHKLRLTLSEHDVSTAVFIGFGGYKNGKLLAAAEEAGFDVLLTGDLSLEYQQNLTGRRIGILSLSANSWRIVQNYIAEISAAIPKTLPGTLVRIECRNSQAKHKNR